MFFSISIIYGTKTSGIAKSNVNLTLKKYHGISTQYNSKESRYEIVTVSITTQRDTKQTEVCKRMLRMLLNLRWKGTFNVQLPSCQVFRSFDVHGKLAVTILSFQLQYHQLRDHYGEFCFTKVAAQTNHEIKFSVNSVFKKSYIK